jgi:sensor c-di-GMP phosphodiesterase-like protein
MADTSPLTGEVALVRSWQKKLVAAILGFLLAGLPLAAFDIWLETLVDQQSADDISASARRAIALIDSRLATVASSLDGLAAQGVTLCTPADLDKLRRASFATSPAKELSVIGPGGETMCTDLGLSLGTRKVVSTPRAGVPGETVVEVVRFNDRGPNYLRMRRFGAGGSSLAALVPGDMLIPLTSTSGGPFSAYERVLTREGLLIGEGGAPLPTDADPKDLLSATMRLDRFGIGVTVTASRSAVEPADLRVMGLTANLLVAFAIVALAILLGRRRIGDPVAEIRRALNRREFVPYYQPIVDITSGKLLGAEVLARWRKRDGTVLLPGAFIPLAEQGGLMIELTQSLMRRTCAEIGAAYARRPHLKVAFNLTARHFADEAIVADVRAIFDRSPISLSQVTLELTEREPIEDLATTRRVITALQGLGCQIALDDVGTGHSGLSSILRLGVDVIKIDKMFIDSLGSEQRNSATIVTTLVELARNMRMEVVAEGVESFEQVMDLRARGIRAAQGYVFAPPLPEKSFLTLLDALDPLETKPAAQAGQAGQQQVA